MGARQSCPHGRHNEALADPVGMLAIHLHVVVKNQMEANTKAEGREGSSLHEAMNV